MSVSHQAVAGCCQNHMRFSGHIPDPNNGANRVSLENMQFKKVILYADDEDKKMLCEQKVRRCGPSAYITSSQHY